MAGAVLVKPGVQFERIAPAGYLILDALKFVARQLGIDLTITSGTDGAHSGPSDPHHLGEAFDVRSHDLSAEMKRQVLHLVRLRLGSRFFGFLEKQSTAEEHFHFQRKKGTTYTVLDFLAA